jgi:HD-like signal output (HDOD) protein
VEIELDKNQPQDLPSWVEFLCKTDIPVLKQTAREMLRLQQDEDTLSARGLSAIIIQDPMMTFRLLRYSQTHQHKNQSRDLVTVEQALLMMGMTTFFKDLPPQPLVQDILKTNLTAQTHLFKLIHRAHRAARFAADWATLLYDMQAEEVYIATLLHDLAEMLMLCFCPEAMNKIYAMQLADKTLRSHDAQQEVLGFILSDLQQALDNASHLPPLLSLLIQDGNSSDRRVKNVSLAVNLARHSAHGWDDAALPDDYRDIAELLRVDVEKVMRIVGAGG